MELKLVFKKKTHIILSDREKRALTAKKKIDAWRKLSDYVWPKIVIAQHHHAEHLDTGFLHPRHDIRMNGRELRDVFGHNGLDVIRHLFVKYQVGGVGSNGKYPTRWKLNIEKAVAFACWYDLLSIEEKSKMTIQTVLKYFVSVGSTPIDRVKIRDDEGAVTDVKFVSPEERKSLPKAKQHTHKKKLTVDEAAKIESLR